MKHRVRAGLTYAATRRNYRIAAASAAFLAVAATTGALMTPSDAPHVAAEEIPVAAAQAAIGVPPAQAVPPSPPAAPGQPVSPPAQPANPDLASPPAPPKAPPAPPKAPPAPKAKVLDYTYEGQPNSYWCGPAATRIALTARDIWRSQGELADRLNTTFSGTTSAVETTRVLNDLTKTNFYRTHEIPGPQATPAQMDKLQADAVHAISNGYAIVANVIGSATLADGRWLDWPGGHYITVVGYDDEGRMLKIADPANPSVSSYWITTIEMANWMGTKGYSA